MWEFGFDYVKAPITIPRQLKLKLIFLHSSNRFPDAPETLTLYEPAKSTRFNLATFIYRPSVSLGMIFICSIVMMKIA